jgi:ankyrin repeat protein
MYASMVGTIPLAVFGWHWGKKINLGMAVLVAIAGVSINFLTAYAYQYKIKKNAQAIRVEPRLDCTKVPYHCAIRDNRLGEIPLLRKNGFDIESRDSLARTALWYGINNEAAVKALLDNGANPDAFNPRSETPLAYVLVISLKPNISLGRLLVKYGAKINRTIGFRKNISILNFAIVNKDSEVINFALENGADPNFVDGYRKSACTRLKIMSGLQIKNQDKYCPPTQE